MAPPENQGGSGESAIDAVASGSRNRGGGASARAGLSSDVGAVRSLNSELTKTEGIVKRLSNAFSDLKRKSSGVLSGMGGGDDGGGAPGTVAGSMGASKQGLFRNAFNEFATGGFYSQGGVQGANMGLGIAGASRAVGAAVAAPIQAVSQGVSGRIGRGAAYSLSADRMSVLYQQMYGMTNAQVRGGVRMPMTENYLLGGPGAINQMMSMQASTGLSAVGQARSVEAFRAMSGFSLDTAGATQMLSTMASPDVANRMFMMGGTGMYGLGGRQNTGMKTIQDIVRRTGLTNPDALKGALQPGSNTRQRLSSMGVPQDMQDMVIQYAMQNTQYQKKTNTTAMYDPSLEADARTMGITESYAYQHEKTAGEMAKREERFYGRQVDNFADFERNLRTATKALAALEDRLSGLIGTRISVSGHPVTSVLSSGMGFGSNLYQSLGNLTAQGLDITKMGIDATTMGIGDAAPPEGSNVASGSASKEQRRADRKAAKLNAHNEAKLATLDPSFAAALRPMLEERPSLRIEGAARSNATQESEFKKRYRPRPDWTDRSSRSDRKWKGIWWEKIDTSRSGPADMAAPGSSLHEQGLAVDFNQSSREDLNWLVENTGRFGLDTGYTGTGMSDDEPFHVQPANYYDKVAQDMEKVAESKSGAGGPTASTATTPVTSGGSSSGAKRNAGATNAVAFSAASNAGQTAGSLGRAGLSQQVSTLIGGVDKPRQLSSSAQKISSNVVRSTASTTGDATGPISMYSMGGGGSNYVQGNNTYSITISPNITISTTGGMSGDLQSMAKEIGRLLENEVKLRMMRTQ